MTRMNLHTQAVLNIIKRHPHGISTIGITGELETMPPDLGNTLKRLKENGHITNTGIRGGSANWVCKGTVSSMSPEQAAEVRDALRHSPCGGRVVPVNKGQDRLSVEAALQKSGMTAQTVRELAQKTGLGEERVKKIINTMSAKGLVKGEKRGSATGYMLMSVLTKANAITARETPWRNSTTGQPLAATWLRSHSDRPGANDAFALPSLVGGVRTPPQKPMSMCTGPAVRAMAIGGGRRFSE